MLDEPFDQIKLIVGEASECSDKIPDFRCKGFTSHQFINADAQSTGKRNSSGELDIGRAVIQKVI